MQMVPVVMGYGPRTTAMVFAMANISGTLILCLMVKHDIPWINYGWQRMRRSSEDQAAYAAVAGVHGISAGECAEHSGVAAGGELCAGATDAVAIFTARTVSRLALQAGGAGEEHGVAGAVDCVRRGQLRCWCGRCIAGRARLRCLCRWAWWRLWRRWGRRSCISGRWGRCRRARGWWTCCWWWWCSIRCGLRARRWWRRSICMSGWRRCMRLRRDARCW